MSFFLETRAEESLSSTEEQRWLSLSRLSLARAPPWSSRPRAAPLPPRPRRASHARCAGAPPRRARRRAPFPDPPPPELATPLASPHPGEAPRSPRPTNFAGTKVITGACMATAPALVEPLPPPHPEPNQPRSWLHLAPRKLTDPFPTAHDRRSAAAAASHHRRLPELVEPPPRTISPRTKYTNGCASASSAFPPP